MMHCYTTFIVGFFLTTVNSLAYDLTYFGSATITDGFDTDDSVGLQGSGIFPAGSGVASTGTYDQALPLDDPCNHKHDISDNFEKRALVPCPDEKNGNNVPSGNTPASPGTPNNPEIPGTKQPLRPEPQFPPDPNLLPNGNPWIEIDSTDEPRKRCGYWKKTYVCTGGTERLPLVDGCYLCTLYFDDIS